MNFFHEEHLTLRILRLGCAAIPSASFWVANKPIRLLLKISVKCQSNTPQPYRPSMKATKSDLCVMHIQHPLFWQVRRCRFHGPFVQPFQSGVQLDLFQCKHKRWEIEHRSYWPLWGLGSFPLPPTQKMLFLPFLIYKIKFLTNKSMKCDISIFSKQMAKRLFHGQPFKHCTRQNTKRLLITFFSDMVPSDIPWSISSLHTIEIYHPLFR